MSLNLSWSRGLSILLLFLVAVTLTRFVAAAPQEARTIPAAKYRGEDNVAFSEPSLDDSTWRQIPLPCEASECGLTQEKHIGWYRLRFDVPEGVDLGGWVLARGRTWGAEELYLNGHKVDQTGVIGEPFSQVWNSPRIYSLPASRLHAGRNVLALRCMNTGAVFGLAFDPVLVGPESLRIQQAKRFSSEGILRNAVIALSATALLAWLVMWGAGVTPNLQFIAVGLVLASSLVSWWLTAPWFPATPTTTFIEAVNYFCFASLSFIFFPFAFLKYKARRIGAWLLAISGLVCCALLLRPTVATVVWMGYLSVPVTLCASVYGLFLLVKGFLQGVPHAGILALGWFISPAASIISLSWPAAYRLPLAELAQVALVIVLLYITAWSHRLRHQRVLGLQQRVLSAAEEERESLAVHLEEKVARDLRAAQVSLQLAERVESLDSRSLRNVLEENIDNLGESLGHIRALSRELHPGFAQERSLAARLELYLEQVRRLSDQDIELVHTGENDNLSPETAKQVFRAAQEAIGQCLRLGAVGKIEVVMRVRQESLFFSVLGGSSMARQAQPAAEERTLAERIEILGGTLEIDDVAGVCRVTVRVPRVASRS